jgi:hypothetical protein
MVMPGILRQSARPVQGEDNREAVETYVQVGLVERPAEEGRVNRHHGPQTAHGHAGGRGHGRLFSDTDIEKPVRETGLERQ